MDKRFVRICLLGVLICYSLVAVPVRAAAPTFEKRACWFEDYNGLREGEDFYCGYVIVPEDHSQPDGKTIKLAIAVFKSSSPQRQPDPVVFLQGGPGGGSVEDFARYLGPAWSRSLRRDLIFIDQRGTGLSEPSLVCQETIQLIYASLNKRYADGEVEKLYLNALMACRDRLQKEGVNLGAFTNRANAADINDLRAALGYEKLNLYGVSYGTHLALTAMRDFPEGLRSVILDSVYPLQIDLFTDTILTTRRIYDKLFEGCAASSACKRAYPDLEQVTYGLIASLNEKPITLKLADPEDGKVYDVVFDGDALASTIFGTFYYTSFIPRLPAMLYTASKGNYAILREIASYTILGSIRGIAEAMYFSVTCEEDIPFSNLDQARVAVMVLPPVLRKAQVDSMAQIYQACAVWPVKPAPASEDQPVVSDVPALVISGEYDPITPSTYAEIAASTLKNSFVFTYPALGHGAAFDRCPFSMIVSFVANPQVKPDSLCIDNMRPPFWEIIR